MTYSLITTNPLLPLTPNEIREFKILDIRREIKRLSYLWSQAHYGDDDVRASEIRCEIEELQCELDAKVSRVPICPDCGRPTPRGVCDGCHPVVQP